MGGPRGCHTEWTTSDREGDILYDIGYIQNIKERTQMNLWNINRLGEQTYSRWEREESGRGITKGFGINMHTLLGLKWVSEDLMHSTGTLCDVTGQPGWELRGVGGMNACVCVAETLLSTSNYRNTVKQQCPNTKSFFFLNKEIGWIYEWINNTSETGFQQLFFF